MFNNNYLNSTFAPGTNFFDQTANAQKKQKLDNDNYNTQLAQNAATRAAAQKTTQQATSLTVGGQLKTGSTYQAPANAAEPTYQAPSYQAPSYASNTGSASTTPNYSNFQVQPSGTTVEGSTPQNFSNGSLNQNPNDVRFREPGNSNSDSTTNGSSFNTDTGSSLNTTFGNDNGALGDVFTKLSDLQERQASRYQIRFNQDLDTQSRVYQDFDNVAARRTSEINRGARQQGYELSSQLSAQSSKQNMAEATNQGQVQANTTNTIRDSDMKRALSILPMRR